ncbi:MAG: 2-C-methyl-D-erythritol 2,4-cyclodiphosphate synthase [Candidatus Obscuribacterales bacterium]|nr:2-C-methyl-D-erythritol 2,4-cyclodiphosphate synthase [Cyanobacteria bacterium SZAS LIN-5]RTL44840.1 MAG: 2-C-methyl-D-erythritol 2,4-cyclodiphosphate synthase [Candidatus Melainabacteria bacterium]
MRIGTGYDVHKFVEGRPLVIGGIRIDYPLGMEGHSDGDPLTHAIIDALLGAAALGDIGLHFPPGDPQYKGADSLVLLEHVYELLVARGYKIVNIDSTIICQAPKMSPYFNRIRESLASRLHMDVDALSVKATTTEKLGYLGRGEAVAAEAVALISKE